jgi:hypothetical protein
MPYVGKAFLVVLLPLLMGTIFYLLFSPGNGVTEIFHVKASLFKANHYLRFLYQSLPDLLWAFAMANYFLLCCQAKSKIAIAIVVTAAFLLCLLFELLQASGIIKGTFDLFDILVYVLGCIFSFSLSDRFLN